MAQRYIKAEKTEDKAFTEQIQSLPAVMKNEMTTLHKEYRKQKTPESVIARDADILECLLQAKEYYELGNKQAIKFTQKAPKFLKTSSGRILWDQAKKADLNDWWIALSDFKR